MRLFFQISATLSFFMLAMVLYPRVQEKLRAEIEAATDGERFPTFNEVKDLPYLSAVIKETLRWRPMGPLG
jgi:cytochrome P450